jgi:2-aminoadipate transaminase
MNYTQILSKRALAAQPNPIDKLLHTVISRADIISFAVGAPSTDLLPIELFEDLTKKAIHAYGREILQYGLPKGFPPLIDAVVPLFAQRGINCATENIHIATGGSGGLNNICMTLLDKNDTVLVENPSYSPAIKTFLAYDAKIGTLECDEEGVVLGSLEQRLKQRKPKFVYLLPTFQNPTGRTMSVIRRKKIAAIIKKHNMLVIEDDVYYDLRYRGDHVPALYSFAPNNVLYIASVSKILAPTMRVGILVLPKPIMGKFLILKHSIDMNTSVYMQALTAEFLKSSHAQTHISFLNKMYSKKLDVMLQALKTYMPKGFVWNKPEGGLFLWVTGPTQFRADVLLAKAVEESVAYVPGNTFFVDQKQGRNTIRLSFAAAPIEKIEEGIKVLAKLCKEAVYE